jgi:hypothetical protein
MNIKIFANMLYNKYFKSVGERYNFDKVFLMLAPEASSEDISLWMNQNKSFFEQLGDFVYLGKGNNGVVYRVGDKVFKFCKEFDYIKAKESQEKIWNGVEGAKYLPNIYDVGYFESINNIPIIYWILMEEVVVRPQQVGGIEESSHLAYRGFRKHLEDLVIRLDDGGDVETITRKINHEMIRDPNTITVVGFMGGGDWKWLKNLIRATIYNIRENNYDLHWHNMGLRQNQRETPVVFDS